jgi:hypothetical protein
MVPAKLQIDPSVPQVVQLVADVVGEGVGVDVDGVDPVVVPVPELPLLPKDPPPPPPQDASKNTNKPAHETLRKTRLLPDTMTIPSS